LEKTNKKQTAKKKEKNKELSAIAVTMI
jgi:hypothetical protein